MVFDECTLPFSSDPRNQKLTTYLDYILGSHPLAIPMNALILVNSTTPPNSHLESSIPPTSASIDSTSKSPSPTSNDTTLDHVTPMPPLPTQIHTPTSLLKPSIKFHHHFIVETTPPPTPS